MFLPRHCAVCRSIGSPLCGQCADLLQPPEEAPPIDGLDRCVALFSYTGAGRVVISGLKFTNHRDCLVPLAGALASMIDRRVDLVTWIPTTVRRRRSRGYDQAELVARAVGRSLGVRVHRTLARTGPAADLAQTGRSRSDRLATRFEPISRPVRRSGLGVVALVDDVRTTGATLGAAGRALRRAGASEVVGATLAATPSAW